MGLEPSIKGDINDKSLGKLLVRMEPRVNQVIKNQNLTNLLVRIYLKWIDIILPDFINKATKYNKTSNIETQKNKPCLIKPSKT